MSHLAQHDSELFHILGKEIHREESTLELIASENFTSQSVMEMAGGVMTNKYAEGYPGKRYYGGCDFVDEAENLARDRLSELFGAEYTNVQPHSGSQANMAALMTFIKPGDTVLGLDLAHGGHLTHGSPVNFSGQLYNFISYHVSRETGRVDFNEVDRLAKEHQPKLIICGGSAYPRFIEFEMFKEIADKCNAFLMADIAHPSGLVAAGLHPSPMPYCDVVTSTTHKTLRGPRGGIIMMGKDFENPWGKIAAKSGRVRMVSELIDSTVMPGIQGGPLMHIIAAKAVAFGEALKPEFKTYAKNVINNAKSMADEFLKLGYHLVSDGTDTHVMLIDLSTKNITGKSAEINLGKAGITVNKNMVPFDERSPFVTSGIRVGTPAITTRGMGDSEIRKIVRWMNQIILDPDNESLQSTIKSDVNALCSNFPIYSH
ncbi:MAG: serine hydroxymethyltransferase [Candidatus Marinimicrobia bacterium]|nr:serine hydroxymethyltransferase [Candidatus Neomarinimicrobiota bacterium]MBT7042025.1 serine hydroxymethyltransferase [Candidatus Neomarinimicrobiota bacterium]